MKTLQIIVGVSIAMILLGLNVALADMKNDSSRVPLTFSLDFGDSSVIMPDLSFDTVVGNSEQAQATCAMTPGGGASGLLLQIPMIPLVHNQPVGYSHASALSSPPPLYSPPTKRHDRSPRRPTTTTTTTTTVVPEPATLVIVGLGIGIAAVARRRWKNR